MAPHASPSTLLAQLRLLAADPGSYFDDAAQRQEFQDLARQAAMAVEEPRETMHRLVYGVSGCVSGGWVIADAS